MEGDGGGTAPAFPVTLDKRGSAQKVYILWSPNPAMLSLCIYIYIDVCIWVDNHILRI